MSRLLPWSTESSQTLLSLKPWFSVVEDIVRLPSGRIVNDFYRIEAPDYVLIAAQRDDGSLLMERHFKQCLQRVVITNPAGAVEDGETPQEAAKRELLEETGFKAAKWDLLGSFVVDGTRGFCTAHLFSAKQLDWAAEPIVSEMEEFELLFMNSADIRAAIRDGQIMLLPDIAIISMLLGPHTGA